MRTLVEQIQDEIDEQVMRDDFYRSVIEAEDRDEEPAEDDFREY